MRGNKVFSQGINWLSIGLAVFILSATTCLGMDNFEMSDVASSSGNNPSAMGTTDAPDFALAMDESGLAAQFYLPYGKLSASGEAALAENVDLANLTGNVNLDEEFYLPYGSFSQERQYGHVAESPAEPEIVAENDYNFSEAPAQCSFGAHSKDDCI